MEAAWPELTLSGYRTWPGGFWRCYLASRLASSGPVEAAAFQLVEEGDLARAGR